MEEEKYIGYIKYEGKLVKEGLMDARKQAKALLGFDSALRYFIGKQAPDFRNLDFEIPVRIKKGSWELLIPETVADWGQAGLGLVVTAYFAKAAQKMAEKDFSDFGITDLFKNAIAALQWFVKIGTHMKSLTVSPFKNTKFTDDNTSVGIQNSEGEYLYVPKNMLDLYYSCNPKLLEKLAENIEDGRELKIGTIIEGKTYEVRVSNSEKAIFCKQKIELEEDVLFPELVHGKDVVLDGEVTRENKTSNSMGFKYGEHILTAYPKSGNIVPYKPLLFLKCRLYGRVDRLDEKGRNDARRPKLVFSHLESLEHEYSDDLFR